MPLLRFSVAVKMFKLFECAFVSDRFYWKDHYLADILVPRFLGFCLSLYCRQRWRLCHNCMTLS